MDIGVKIDQIGVLGDSELSLFTLQNNQGHRLQITNFGGIVHSWICPDRYGQLSDILLGCKNLQDYQGSHPYFGAIVGRYANRIAFGKFKLDGKEYTLQTNSMPHHLHGGLSGFDKKIWEYKILHHADKCTLQFNTSSPHMEEGYSGNLMIEVRYTFNNDNELIMEYTATTDAPTVVNLTNHCYFNLTGNQQGDILDHEVCIIADNFTEVDETLVPTGRINSVEGTILDLRKYMKIRDCFESQDIMFLNTKGFDHNFVVNDHIPESPVAKVIHEISGRKLEVYSDQPGIQLYTGNWLQDVEGKEGKYKDYAGLCLETQHFPDSPNHSNFPSTVLVPGEQFFSRTVYKVSTF